MNLESDFKVLNYLTAPDVVVWSACLASMAIPGMYSPQKLYMKNENGEIVLYHQDDSAHIQYQDGSVAADLPIQRIAELFNVNTYIVSQVNPTTVPFIWNTEPEDMQDNFASPKRFVYSLVKNEIQHIRNQCHALGLAPKALNHIYKITSLTSKGHI